jgi:hypothetical protein
VSNFNLTDTLKNVGAGALGGLGPIGGAAIAIINEFLPDGEKLNSTSTGDEALAKVDKLPPTEKENIANSLYAFKTIESNNTLKAAIIQAQTRSEEVTANSEVEMLRIMEESDRQSHYRPKIAMMFSIITALLATSIGLAMAYRWAVAGDEPSWDVLAIVLYVPVHVTLRWFNIRSDEKQLFAALLSRGKIAPRMKVADAIEGIFTKRQK